ncbi:hypothetical protein EYF80_015943 [Liparis tanakae]|uniref:Uncharacterized protein n=1 Tax=Liparis tanakae TaxID=230148 RepID=A0A4Z2I798_9TELE|nr:hypothetical protein EYF80_015943 [Liparis tanakae]
MPMQRSEKAKWHMRKRGTVSLERLPDDGNTGGKKKDNINNQKYCSVPQQREDGDDPDEDPQGDGRHDVLTGVKLIWGLISISVSLAAAVFIPTDSNAIRTIAIIAAVRSPKSRSSPECNYSGAP